MASNESAAPAAAAADAAAPAAVLHDDLTKLQNLVDGVALSMFTALRQAAEPPAAAAAAAAAADPQAAPQPATMESATKGVLDAVAAVDACIDGMDWLDKSEAQQRAELAALDGEMRAQGAALRSSMARAEGALAQQHAVLRAIAENRLVAEATAVAMRGAPQAAADAGAD